MLQKICTQENRTVRTPNRLLAPAPFARTLAVAVALVAAPAAAQVTVTIEPSKDNTLYVNASGLLSNGAGSRMFCGRTGGGLTRRALVAFDVASQIPPCSTIVSVDLTLQMVMTRGGLQAVTLHRVLQDWGEANSVAGGGQGSGGGAQMGDATWIHTFFNTRRWTTPGGDFAAAANGTTMVGGFGSYTWSSTPQMVGDVQGWLDDPTQSFGWMVRTVETGSFTAKAFSTKESGAASRPRLRVTYDPPTAAVTAVGRGCTGSGAAPLTLGTNGNPTVPNPSFTLGLTGGPVGPHAFAFTTGLAKSPIPIGGGCFVFVDPATKLVALVGDANRNLLEPVPNDTRLLGVQLAVQGAVLDGITSFPVTSNALVLKLGT